MHLRHRNTECLVLCTGKRFPSIWRLEHPSEIVSYSTAHTGQIIVPELIGYIWWLPDTFDAVVYTQLCVCETAEWEWLCDMPHFNSGSSGMALWPEWFYLMSWKIENFKSAFGQKIGQNNRILDSLIQIWVVSLMSYW